jgi:uncharacterized RDD family membrane protein YckC
MENSTPPFYKEKDVLGLEKPEIKPEETDESLPESPPELDLPYAGLHLRIIAGLIDGIILVSPIIVDALVFDITYSVSKAILLLITGYTLYFGLTESSAMQASIGKRLAGLKVVNEYGQKLSFLNASLRFIASLISILPLGLGIWAIAFDRKKQAWHDELMGTYVVRKN